VALGCCLALWAVREGVKSSTDDGSVGLAGGAPLWEEFRKAAAEEFLRGVDDELAAQVKIAPPPTQHFEPPPAGTDVLMTGEIGPARRSKTNDLTVLVRLRVRDRHGDDRFVSERWTEPFPERVVWDDSVSHDFRRAVGPAVDDLMRRYKMSLSR